MTWPNIRARSCVVVILRLAFNLAKIDQPFTLTGGGPGYETSVLSILMYRFAFMSGDFGMAFTVGMFLVAIDRAADPAVRVAVPAPVPDGLRPAP